MEVRTPTGCVLSTRRATRSDVEALGVSTGGVFLAGRMDSPNDDRTFEVFLSWENCTELSNGLNFGRT